MSEHRATVRWEHTRGDFRNGTYARSHVWQFDGGVSLAAAPSPHVVNPAYGDPAAVDPEEAFVASIASCHLLTFLWVASRRGLVVTAYADDAVGHLTKNERRIPWVSSVTLRPEVTWGHEAPSDEVLHALHHEAHEQCFIANSVKTEIRVEPKGLTSPG